jgi:hypothetical protein
MTLEAILQPYQRKKNHFDPRPLIYHDFLAHYPLQYADLDEGCEDERVDGVEFLGWPNLASLAS